MEEWRRVKGSTCYEVSNTGKVRSINRVLETKNGIKKFYKGKPLSLQTDHHGYLVCYIKDRPEKSRYFVHRLVAEAFIENDANKPCVNHIDNNPQNNDVSNLERNCISQK